MGLGSKQNHTDLKLDMITEQSSADPSETFFQWEMNCVT